MTEEQKRLLFYLIKSHNLTMEVNTSGQVSFWVWDYYQGKVRNKATMTKEEILKSEIYRNSPDQDAG